MVVISKKYLAGQQLTVLLDGARLLGYQRLHDISASCIFIASSFIFRKIDLHQAALGRVSAR